MRNYFISCFILLFTLLIFNSCSNEGMVIDESDTVLKLMTHRFDHDLLEINIESAAEERHKLYQKYGDFYSTYTEQIIRIGSGESDQTVHELKRFTSNPMISLVQNDIDSIFTQEVIQRTNNQLELAFKRFKTVFPETEIPAVIYHNSGFNIGVAVMEEHLGIGLDFYLGPDNRIVQKLTGDQFQHYKRNKMHRDFLVSDALKYWSEIELDAYREDKNLLSQVIFSGKIAVLMDALLPEIEEHYRMHYFVNELAWANENEENIWQEFAKEDIVYGTNTFENKKWLVDAPFTNVGAIPDDSPARLGEWLGKEIVLDYINDHPGIGFKELFENKDYQKILQSYDPRN